MAGARFDDLRPGGRAFALDGLEGILSADTVDGVEDVLRDAETAVAAGRWVAGWVAYEAAPAFDPAFEVVFGDRFEGLPLAWFGVFSARIPAPTPQAEGGHASGPWRATVDASRHLDDVRSIRSRIRAGDVYQVNQTFQMQAPFTGATSSLYTELCGAQRAGYAAHIDAGRWGVVSVSPEAFFEWRDGVIRSRPMKGTAPRGRDLAEDARTRLALAASEKDRAENVMIVDMVRNDVGRIAVVGSVDVPELLTAERYETVWQLTSTVEATPRPGTTLAEVFGAMFPAASITGAPKGAAMHIIAELEDGPRGVYTGAVGFGGPTPGGGAGWAFNVAIRTVLVDRDRDVAWYGTGGGVTFDSSPSAEYDEAILKTRVLDRGAAPIGLVETLRWVPHEGFHRLAAHLDRLADSGTYFDIPVDRRAVADRLDESVAGCDQPQRVRLALDREGVPSTRVDPLPAPSAPTVVIDDEGVDPSDPFLRHKTTRRDPYEQAARRHPDADDVILTNLDGAVTETTIANLAVRLDGTWWTPPVDDGCLPGVERSALLAEGRIRERSLGVDDVVDAEGLARFNALRGWEPMHLRR